MRDFRNPIIRRIGAVVGILIMGALGSGLWDVFLKDLLYAVGGIFVKTISYGYSGYIDSLYSKVGSSINALLYLPSIAIILLVIMSPIIVFLRYYIFYPHNNQEEDGILKATSSSVKRVKHSDSRKRIWIFFIVTFIIISIFYMDILVKEVSYLKARNYIERSIEIIRPSIDDHMYYVIRSEFRQIDNREKTNNVIRTIQQVADSNKIILPECKLYGITNFNNRSN